MKRAIILLSLLLSGCATYHQHPAADLQVGPDAQGVVRHPESGRVIDCEAMKGLELGLQRSVKPGLFTGEANAPVNYQVGGVNAVLFGLTPDQVTLGRKIAAACSKRNAPSGPVGPAPPGDDGRASAGEPAAR